jgi:Xylose isomerase-like TIM barrel
LSGRCEGDRKTTDLSFDAKSGPNYGYIRIALSGVPIRLFERKPRRDCGDRRHQCPVGSSFCRGFPTDLSQDIIDAITAGFTERKLTLAALSGTCNMIDPDLQARQAGAESLKRLIAWAPRLGTDVVTLCTGSRDPSNMWRKHPDNDTLEAWADLLVQLEEAVRVAEKYGVRLGVELLLDESN